MISKSINITLDRAKEWYNSGNCDLVKLALEAFNVNELNPKHFSNIKTFDDVLNGCNTHELFVWNQICSVCDEQVKSLYKLKLIRKVLNDGWEPSLVKGDVYYPFIRFYKSEKAKKRANRDGVILCDEFVLNEKKYTVAGGDVYDFSHPGLAGFNGSAGAVRIYLGLLGCKSREIAKHMSTYFSKEIFDASYSETIEYKWI